MIMFGIRSLFLQSNYDILFKKNFLVSCNLIILKTVFLKEKGSASLKLEVEQMKYLSHDPLPSKEKN